MSQELPGRDRLFDLLADQAVQPLTDQENAELEVLLQVHADVDPTEFEYAAAAAHLAMLAPLGDEDDQEMPAELLAAVQSQASQMMRATSQPAVSGASTQQVVTSPTSSFSVREGVAWLTAAAALMFALFILNKPAPKSVPDPLPRKLSLSERRESVLEVSDHVHVAWHSNEDASKTETGDIVWSNELQQGFMRFNGLEVLPENSVYQLWIFDRKQKNPIDGGVFSMPEDDEVIVPVNAAIRTQEVYQFAVTVERAPGVVVSGQERITVLAAVSPEEDNAEQITE